MRIATYNVEWFHRLFEDDGTLRDDDRWSARHNVTRAQQLAALGHVFRAMDADGVMIIEAPDSHKNRDGIAALENFAKRYKLRTRKAVMGFINDTKQEIAFLYDPDAMTVRHDPRHSTLAPRFDEVYTSNDTERTQVRWSKPPLELEVETETRVLRMIGVHAKSKAAHGVSDPGDVVRVSIENRRKQLTQCAWLRARVLDHLSAGDSLIVLGDFNDGPGLDQYESLFGKSGVEQVLGPEGDAQLFDPHARTALSQRIGVSATTARFYLAPEKRFMQALLDYVMVSPDLVRLCRWRIWHPFDDPKCWETVPLRDALITASDHFPVCVDLD